VFEENINKNVAVAKVDVKVLHLSFKSPQETVLW